MSETREDKEKRQQREYETYVADCKTNGLEAINFMNWHFNEKHKALAASGKLEQAGLLKVKK